MHTAGESERVVREPLGVHLARVLQLDDTLYQITVCVCVCVCVCVYMVTYLTARNMENFKLLDYHLLRDKLREPQH